MIFFFVGIVSLSQSANLVRAAEAHPFVVGFWRLLVAAAIMAALRYLSVRKSKAPFFETTSYRQFFPTVSSGVFFFLHLWTFFIAAQTTSIANCMVIFATNPVFTAIGAWLLLKEAFHLRHGLAFLFAFAGVAILFSDRFTLDQARFGDIAALISAFFFSLYIITGKKSRLSMSTEQFTWVIYLISAILFFSAGEIQNVTWTGYPLKTWLAIGGTILFPTLLGHVLITHLLKYFNVNWLSCGKLTEPVFSSIVAYYVFGEALSARTGVAFFFTALAMVVLLWPFFKSQLKSKAQEG